MSYNVDAFTFKDRHELYKLQQDYINETKRGEYNKLTSKNDTITLYHGTSSHLIPEILANGWGNPDVELPAHPCYIEIEVPASSLTLDEDIFMSQYMQDLYEKHEGNPAPYATVEGALETYGTLAHIGVVPPSAIKSFTILGNKQSMVYCIKGAYHDDYTTWQKGLGLGNLTVPQIKQWGTSLAGNKTYEVALLPKNKRVVGVHVDKHSLKVSLKTEKIKA